MSAILRRELVTMLRSPLAMVLQVVLLAALAVLVGLRWPADARVDVDGFAAQQVKRVVGYGALAGVILLAPVFPTTSIVRERMRGTLALLLNSPLQPAEIVVGKLAASVAFVLLLVLLTLPTAGACFVLGGVSLAQLAWIYLVLVLLAIQYVTLALLVSSVASSTESALRLMYGLILLLTVVSQGPYQLVSGQFWASEGLITAADWLRSISPMPAMMQLLGDSRESGAALRFCLLAPLSAVAFLCGAVVRLRQGALDRSRAAGRITDDRSARARALRRVLYLWFFDPQRRTALIGPLANPVLVKEQRCRKFGRGNWMMRLTMGCVLVSLMLMVAAAKSSQSQGVGTMGGIMVMLQVSLVILLTPSLAGGLFSGERESRGWQLLQMTPMSVITIVSGKLMSVMVTLAMVLLATLSAYAVLIYIDPGQWYVASSIVVTLILTAMLALLVSAAVSSLFANTAAATATAYVILITLCLGTLLVWLGENAPFSRSVVERVLSVNPLAAALTLIQAPGFYDYQLVPANWFVTALLCMLSAIVLMVQVWRLSRPQ